MIFYVSARLLPDIGNYCSIHKNTFDQCRIHFSLLILSVISGNSSFAAMLLVVFIIELQWKHEDSTYLFAKTFFTLQENVGFLLSLLNLNPKAYSKCHCLFTVKRRRKNLALIFTKLNNFFTVLSTVEASGDDNMNEWTNVRGEEAKKRLLHDDEWW